MYPLVLIHVNSNPANSNSYQWPLCPSPTTGDTPCGDSDTPVTMTTYRFQWQHPCQTACLTKLGLADKPGLNAA